MPAPPSGPPLKSEIACVLDVGLTLRPSGLHWALALASVVPCWITQAHWSIVEDPFASAHDAQLAAWLTGDTGPAAQTALARTVERWREARDALGFESRPDLYWHGFGRVGSVVPKDGDGRLIDRVEALAAGFDARREPLERCSDLRVDSARDALALAAGLDCRCTVLLAPRDGDTASERPTVARELDAIRVPCIELADGRLLDTYRRALNWVLVRSGLLVALAGGRVSLASLALVAPRASQLLERQEDELAFEDLPNSEEAALWDDAAAVWWTLP
jgi:hypothetical protein